MKTTDTQPSINTQGGCRLFTLFGKQYPPPRHLQSDQYPPYPDIYNQKTNLAGQMNARWSMVTLTIYSCWICSSGCCLMICLSCGGILNNSAANLTPCTFDRVSKAHHMSSHSQVWLSGVKLFITINENRLFSAYKLSKHFHTDESHPSIHPAIQPSIQPFCLMSIAFCKSDMFVWPRFLSIIHKHKSILLQGLMF